jgi:hypothetical protein
MRKELIILLVLFGIFLAIGCAGNKGGAPTEKVTPPVQQVTPIQEVTRTTIAGNNTTATRTTIAGNNTTATRTTIAGNNTTATRTTIVNNT